MKRSVWIAIGLIVVLAVLGAGAFTAVQLLTTQNDPDVPAGAQVFEDVFDDGSGNPVTVKTVILPAPEIPISNDGVGGVFLRQEDNSYFVGTGDSSVSVQVENGEAATAIDHSGPEVEVVVSQDTIFYEDITEVSFAASEGESKEQTVQQEVRQVDPPSDLTQGVSLMVWGERRGDRIVATVVVFAEGR
jgi:hypothetical protein